ncbi:hypothetical protein O988_08000 [Pseudogymnoascus sp. VKM F-3808]|nr:hypothetical protein O988_08000 [Pseudogymnoascus sp. VKM F-3808]
MQHHTADTTQHIWPTQRGEHVGKEPAQEGAEPATNGTAQTEKPMTRKKEKKKKSDEERKARKEKKRKLAEENGAHTHPCPALPPPAGRICNACTNGPGKGVGKWRGKNG